MKVYFFFSVILSPRWKQNPELLPDLVDQA